MSARLALCAALMFAVSPAMAQKKPAPSKSKAEPAAAAPAFKHVPLTGDPAAQAKIWEAVEAMRDYRRDAARDALGDALRTQPDMVMANLLMSELAKTPQERKKAINDATRAAKKQKLTPWEKVLLEITQANFAGKAAPALKLYDKLIKLQPEEPWFYIFRGLATENIGTPAAVEKARADYDKAVTMWPGCRAGWNLLGYAYVALGKTKEALNALTKYVELSSPRLPNPHDSLGEVLLRAGKLKDAEKEYRTALRLDPGFNSAHLGLGYTLINMGLRAKKPETIALGHKELETAIAKSSEPSLKALALQMLVVSYLLEKKHGIGVATLDRFEKFARQENDPEMLADADLFTAEVHTVIGFFRQAHQKMEEAAYVVRDPRVAPAFRQRVLLRRGILRAIILLELGEPDAAEARIKALTKQAKDQVWAHDTLNRLKGAVLVFRGAPRKAIPVLTGATVEQPEVLYFLGRAQQRSGDLDAARVTFQMLSRSTVLAADSALWRVAADEVLHGSK